jgi:hypothetical protein
VGVTIMVNGQPEAARVLIGNSGAAEVQAFDFVQAVQPGTTIDFVVDPGPGRDAGSDSTTFSATIVSVGAPASTASAGSGGTSTTTGTTGSTSPGSTSTTTGGTGTTTGSSGGASSSGSSGPTAPATVQASSAADFSLAQGQNGWSYGYFTGSPGVIGPLAGSTFVPMTAAATAWTGSSSPLAITATTLYPYAAGIVQVDAVRRWTSPVTGNVQVSGSFAIGHDGDGVGVTVMVNGQAVVPRLIIGNSGSTQTQAFSFVQAVVPGTTIDFVVDAGPGRDDSNDSTTFNATIVTSP